MVKWQIKPCKTKTCGAPLAFAVVAATGKRIPLDADRKTGAPLEIVDQGQRGRVVEVEVPRLFEEPGTNPVAVRVLKDNEPGPPMVWRAHFATCKRPDDHRKPRNRT